MQANDVSTYLEMFGKSLMDGVRNDTTPLWTSGSEVPDCHLLRQPMAAQWDRIMALKAAWDSGRQGDIVSADMGVGKTLIASVSAHIHSNGKPYRALVVCPSHLPTKWAREVMMTIPGAKTRIIQKYSDVLGLSETEPTQPEWWIMSGNKAKLSTPWVGSYVKKRNGFLHCPQCDKKLEKSIVYEGANVMVPCSERDMNKTPKICECGSALYQWTHKFDRWPVASIVQRKERNAFKYLILDEVHESKGQDTAIGLSVGKLAATIPYSAGLTGTLLNGYADSILPLSYRLFPAKMKALGIKWGDTMGFVKRYGRIETVTTYKDKESYANRQSRGGGRTSSVRVKPGIVPSLYGDCLLENSVFCSLEDLDYDLPNLTEHMDEIEMDYELKRYYRQIESEIRSNVANMIRNGNKGAMAAMINTLMGWPDHPYGFGDVGFRNADDSGKWVTVCRTPDLEEGLVRNKEQKLVDIVTETVNRNRQVWVYCEMTQKHDVQPRLKRLLEGVGLNVEILKSNTVKTCDREAWIYKNGKADVIISNPAIVRTGLDLFDRGGNHNFSTLIFYQTGYRLYTLRQASARSYRIGQELDCEVRYMYYTGTMQESAMKLMSEKTIAAKAIDGKFTSSALTALANGGGDTAAMMLAKMLVSKSFDFEPAQERTAV